MDKLKKILIIVICAVLVIIIGFLGTLFWFRAKANKVEKVKEVVEKHKTISHKIEDAIVTNVADDKKAFVRVSIELELYDDTKEQTTFAEELKANEGAAVNTIIAFLRSKTTEEVIDPKAPLKFGPELTKEINEVYETENFKAVYFKEFINQ